MPKPPSWAKSKPRWGCKAIDRYRLQFTLPEYASINSEMTACIRGHLTRSLRQMSKETIWQ